MTIMINDYCNVDCRYCFAKKTFSSDKKDITMENFEYALNFLKKSNIKTVKLLGGEPTLHPKFKDMVKRINDDDFFNNICIFTNGLSLNEDIIKGIISNKIQFLISFNHPKHIGQEK